MSRQQTARVYKYHPGGACSCLPAIDQERRGGVYRFCVREQAGSVLFEGQPALAPASSSSWSIKHSAT